MDTLSSDPLNSGKLFRFTVVSILSGSRLITGGLFVFFALDSSRGLQKFSLVILAVLFLSDFCDGPLARRWGVTTKFGFVIDGLGDRAAYLACLLVMSTRLGLPILFTYLIVLRDVILYAARSVQTFWDKHHSRTRWIAKSHAGLLRLIFLAYFTPFYLELFGAPKSWLRYRVPDIWLVVTIALCVLFAYMSLWFVLQGYRRLGYNLFQDC